MALTRRQLIRMGMAAPLASLIPLSARAATYQVGVGRDASPYAATVRAIDASGEWPSARIAGSPVIVKPNIVSAAAPDTGTITDPEVVRAIVDRALADGATSVAIVEANPTGPLFDQAGYGYFASYDPLNRVRLVDLQPEPLTLAPLANALAFPAVYLANLLLDPTAVFISAAKLKTHGDAIATLSMKNLFGLPAVDHYIASFPPYGRFGMHDRGVSETVIDLNRLRPIDFAVIDGIYGMEGAGPLKGTPVYMETVLAGRNPVAVDRVALAAMQIPQSFVQHIAFASRFGLGPSTISEITTGGDPLNTRAFALPTGPPLVEYPRIFYQTFQAGASQCYAVQWYAETCVRKIEVVRAHDDQPALDVIATLRAWGPRAGGYETVSWDGRDSSGAAVPPGRYAIHVKAYHTSLSGRPGDGIGWVYTT